ncbi:hypothetical protein [Kribbella sp. NPDC023855]|uniref:hypothetical protein n=1 Tax=Kribbella sp. NPDC023855 TaxID=3154698 RepID=UPI0033E378C6
MTAIDLTSLPIHIPPRNSKALTDALAGRDHELAEVDQIGLLRSLVLPQQLEPVVSFGLLQRPCRFASRVRQGCDLSNWIQLQGPVADRKSE